MEPLIMCSLHVHKYSIFTWLHVDLSGSVAINASRVAVT